jgi:hypothetical protein
LAFFLGAHPQIATVGEMSGLIVTDDPDRYRCSCGQRITRCEFWQSIEKAMNERGFAFNVSDFGTEFARSGYGLSRSLRYGSSGNRFLDAARDTALVALPSERKERKLLTARNIAFIRSVLQVTGKKVFLDTSKDRQRLTVLHKCSKMDVRAIHLVRDARGVVASRIHRRGDLGGYIAARDWVKLNRRLEATLSRLPREKATFVRYEDLCRAPGTTLRHLHRFCGVEPGHVPDSFRETPQHIVGNSMRLGPDTVIVLDERWKSELSEIQLRDIERAAGSMQARYGYA